MQSNSRIKDLRAFSGGVALVLVGLQLSVMMGFYFIPGGEAFAILQSRWWWELALNLQIVCFFLMYLCHSVRMKESVGSKKLRAYWRFAVGMLGVSVPSWVTVIAANHNWFREPPKQADLIYFAGLVFILWVISAYVIPVVLSIVSPSKRLMGIPRSRTEIKKFSLYLSPVICLILLYGMETVRGGHSHIIMWPFLTYFFGAVHYFKPAFSLKQEKA